MRTLIALPYSPWSEKARWALDHHAVPYVEEQYKPMIGEPRLRIRARKPSGKITVPILFEDDLVLCDSLDIAKHAEAIGTGEPLFPEELAADVEAWTRRGEDAMAEGRTRLLGLLRRDPEVQAESLEGVVPAALRRPLRGVASFAMAFLARKHGDVTPPDGTLVATLDALREALDRNGGTVLSKPSFADIAMAAMLQGVRPVDDRYIRLGTATRKAWTHEELAAEYEDLLAWRDALYARRRR